MTTLLARTEESEATARGPIYWLTGPLTLPMPYDTPTADKLQKVLATLLFYAGQAVPVSSLIDELWDGKPPRSAVTTIQTYILHLRRLGFSKEVLETTAGGYRLNIERGLIDVLWFEDQVAAIMEQRQATMEGLTSFASVLKTLRGFILAGIDCGPVLQPLKTRFIETRLSAMECRFDWALSLGLSLESAPALGELVTEHPFHEGFAELYMQTLYRSGRRAQALAVYQKLRKILVAELGIEPRSSIQKLQQAVLNDGNVRPAPLTA